MLGAILGDIIGSRFEFSNTAINKDFKLYTKDSTYTDDTVMTLAIADALMCVNNRYDENEVKKMIIQKMKEYGHRYPLAGYGYSFSKWLFSESDQPYGSYGNGSALRVSAIGYMYDNLEDTINAARWSAEVTHNHIEGIKGATATAAIIFLARSGKNKKYISEYIKNNYDYDIDTPLSVLSSRNEHIESCMDSLPKSIVSFLEGNSFIEVIRNAVSLGGDTDTIGAIAGAMAESYYGIPQEYDYIYLNKLDDDMLETIINFKHFINN